MNATGFNDRNAPRGDGNAPVRFRASFAATAITRFVWPNGQVKSA